MADRRYDLQYHAEHYPLASSRVSLLDEVNSSGLPRLIIDMNFSYDNAAGLARAHRLLGSWLEGKQLAKLSAPESDEAFAEAILAQLDMERIRWA